MIENEVWVRLLASSVQRMCCLLVYSLAWILALHNETFVHRYKAIFGVVFFVFFCFFFWLMFGYFCLVNL